jgi:hypothetical protein
MLTLADESFRPDFDARQPKPWLASDADTDAGARGAD